MLYLDQKLISNFTEVQKMTIGEKIKELRKKHNITQEKLAEQLNVSYQAVSKWENNVANPDFSLIVPLAKLFKVTTDELLCFDLSEVEVRKKELLKAHAKTFATGDIEEQIKITDYLEKKCAEIDTLIAKKTALLEEMETYKKSVIYEYVTGKKEVQ